MNALHSLTFFNKLDFNTLSLSILSMSGKYTRREFLTRLASGILVVSCVDVAPAVAQSDDDYYEQIIDEFDRKELGSWTGVSTGEATVCVGKDNNGDNYLYFKALPGSRIYMTLSPRIHIPSKYNISHIDFYLNVFEQGHQIIRGMRETQIAYPLLAEIDVKHRGGRTKIRQFYSAKPLPCDYESVPEGSIYNATISLVDCHGRSCIDPTIEQIKYSVNAYDAVRPHHVGIGGLKVRAYK